MISYREAAAAIAAACAPGPEESVPACGALGAVASGTVVGAIASPPFNNAAMDGFALRAEDTAGAAEDSPVELPVVGELKAGAFAQSAAPGPGRAIQVATGALTPPPLDTVLPLEQAAVIERPGATMMLRFAAPVQSGRNLRIMGEEYSAGAAFNFNGRRIHAGHMALFAAAGISELRVRKPPPLGLLTTGNEVRPPDVPLAPGEIANVNAAWMTAWCAERGIPVAFAQHFRDSPGDLADGFRRAREAGAKVLVSSGSASAGRRDVLRQALEDLGARIVFHGVAMRPGKPALFALLDDEALILGLPGNPLATAAGMRFLAWPAIRAILGMEAEQPRRMRLADSCDLREGYTHFLLARRSPESEAVKPVRPQRPGHAGALARADCWLRLDGGRFEARAPVRAYSL